jgi:2-succinyl-5-enolpyruvyl-6-hydroxy-3-cyclohexene-1-carboxylate synthase
VSEADRAYAASWWVVDDLVRAGLEHACVSPGSRSTPLALALARHPSVTVHVHVDERAGGFFALGVAKSTGRPAAAACTSGTAVAELFPAVVEASMSRTPLVLLTADRPPELRGVGANQAIDQPGIFGSYVRASVDAPVPGDARDEATWHELAHELIRASWGPPPGPVHLNLPFREPLVPEPVSLPASAPSGDRPEIVEAPRPDDVAALVEEIASTERGVFLAGTLRETPPLLELADRSGWPLAAEPTSGARRPGALAAPQLLIGDERFAAEHVPDVVVQLGAAPTSRAGLALVRRARRLVIVDPDRLVADPHRRAARTIRTDAAALVAETLGRLPLRPAGEWLRAWREADVVARTAADELLDGWDEPFEGRIARDVAASGPEGSVLVVGSSMPVRDLDAFMAPRDGLGVIGNRGASGIDGFVSTTLGVAAGVSPRPVTALCGDLTLLHDAGSLLWNARRGDDLVLVVANNNGGVIFSFLEQRELPELEALFTTPHGLDLGAVSRAGEAAHSRVDRASDLVPAIARARAAGGVHVVEMVVDARRNVRRHAEVRAAIADALARA